MFRSTSRRLADQRAISMLLGCAAMVFATAAVCEGVVIGGSNPPRPSALDLTGADVRSATAHCGAYDVLIIGHDMASAREAQKAALAYFDAHCDYQSGLPAKL